MALQLTAAGSGRFLQALQDEIRQAILVDADGNELKGWTYEPKPIDPEEWDGGTYSPGITWMFVQSVAREAPIVVAGLAWTAADGTVLAIEPMLEPFVVEKTGQTLMADPTLRVFGVMGQA